MKKRKLFLLHDIPYPDTDGGKKLSLGRIMEALRYFDVTVIAFNYQGINSTESEVFFRAKGVDFHCYESKYRGRGGLYKAGQYLSSLFTKHPFYCVRLSDELFSHYVSDIIRKTSPDKVSVETIFLVSYIEQYINIVNDIEIVFHNIESLFFKELFKSSNQIYKKIFYFIESKKINSLEKIISTQINNKNSLFPVFLSEVDASYYKDTFNFNNNKLRINSNKIYLEKTVKHHPNFKNPYFLFPGSVDFPPNKEAMLWLLDEYVKQFEDPFTIVITGKITKTLKKEFLKYKCIRFSGFVSNEELIKYYGSCICVISPIISGGGVKVKNIEAISLLIPILMTEFSAIGIDSKNNALVKVCKNDPNIFSTNLRHFCREIEKVFLC
jgi:mannosyltransferase